MHQNQEILSDLKEHLQQHLGDDIRDVVLFGSRAYGNAREDSDYDVLIILNRDYTSSDEEQILDLCYEIDLKYDILIDAHLLSVAELNSPRGRQPIFTNAMKEGLYA